MNTFAALAFSNILQLIAAFKNGAVFQIVFKSGHVPYPVTDISEESSGKLRVTYKTANLGTFTDDGFQADGRHESSASCWLRMVKGADPQPFLKQFVNGTPAYNPKTRETVKSIEFVSGAIKVTLTDEAGNWRVSDRYDHEGRHRWVKERSLVLGDLPPKPVVMKEVTLEVFHSAIGVGNHLAHTAGSPGARLKRQGGAMPLATVTVQVPA
ncbi:hypothetical protein [Achromobacter sp. DH1f]|uniref:hypothetical protein n=1 Tax=Achromobacter sp. DH1f TaxID=1397275 RepID=UPI0004698C9B|nr:hypothetical protein [Achromobacter sp. DH1f]